jgi:hypothetical protein
MSNICKEAQKRSNLEQWGKNRREKNWSNAEGRDLCLCQSICEKLIRVNTRTMRKNKEGKNSSNAGGRGEKCVHVSCLCNRCKRSSWRSKLAQWGNQKQRNAQPAPNKKIDATFTLLHTKKGLRAGTMRKAHKKKKKQDYTSACSAQQTKWEQQWHSKWWKQKMTAKTAEI